MDNSDYGIDRAAFDAVWQRILTDKPGAAVTPKASGEANASGEPFDGLVKTAPVSEGDLKRMREFMDDEAGDAITYAELAGMCSGCCRQTLLKMSADEKKHLKKLRAQYFIRTGKTYTPPGCCPLIRTFGETLRLKYTGELEGSQSYRSASGETRDGELAALYATFAEDEKRHHQLIGGLIEGLF